MTKALVCADCLDIRALDPRGAWTVCRCGACEARWEDSSAGTVRCRLGGHPATRKAREESGRVPLRIMAMHNGYLVPAIVGPSHEQMIDAGGQWEWWRLLAEKATRAPGYIFDASRRNTWATIVRVNETSDIKWEPYPETPEGSTETAEK